MTAAVIYILTNVQECITARLSGRMWIDSRGQAKAQIKGLRVD